MVIVQKIGVAFLLITSFTCSALIEYKALRESAQAMNAKGLLPVSGNIITNGIPKRVLDDWAVLLMYMQEYIEFRTKDETVDLVDVTVTFQNLLTIKGELLKAIGKKALDPQSAPLQLLSRVHAMIHDKMNKIKNIPVLGMRSQYDLWFLLDQVGEFLDALAKRILIDLGKLSNTPKN